MNTGRMRYALLAIAIIVLGTGVSYAEVTVSITVTGTLKELAPYMEQLKELGTVPGAKQESDAPVKLQVHSITKGTEEAVEVKLPQKLLPKPQPVLGIKNPVITPDIAKAGQPIKVSTKVYDRNHIVDTVAVMIAESGVSFDLYDDGTNGDSKPLDGIWEGSIVLPDNIEAGNYILRAMPFDKNGERLRVRGVRKPVMSETKLTVKK